MSLPEHVRMSGGIAPSSGARFTDPEPYAPETRPSFDQKGPLQARREKMLRRKAAFIAKQRAKKKARK